MNLAVLIKFMALIQTGSQKRNGIDFIEMLINDKNITLEIFLFFIIVSTATPQ